MFVQDIFAGDTSPRPRCQSFQKITIEVFRLEKIGVNITTLPSRHPQNNSWRFIARANLLKRHCYVMKQLWVRSLL